MVKKRIFVGISFCLMFYSSKKVIFSVYLCLGVTFSNINVVPMITHVSTHNSSKNQ